MMQSPQQQQQQQQLWQQRQQQLNRSLHRASESLTVLQQRTNEGLVTLKERTNEPVVVLRTRTNEGLHAMQHHASRYQDTLTQQRDRTLAVLRDKDQREALFQKLKEHNKYLRLWRTHIFLPCIILLSFWNVLAFTLDSGGNGNSELADGAPLLSDSSNENSIEISSPLYQHHRQASEVDVKAAIASTVIDIISIGSLLKQEYQDAQVRTFGQHPSIRDFYRVTEKNDTDSACFTSLTTDQLDYIIDFCANTKDESYISSTLRKRLFEPKKHTGWMCAQKRPLDGLHQVLQRYKNNVTTIPDYLFIIDDDSYLNMDALTADLLHYHPVDKPFAVAGCNFNFLKSSGITFPYGGFGTYLTKAAIQRLIKPFYCDGRDDHSTLGCWRLNFNAIGEKQFFTEGMSVADLMQTYAAKLPFTDVESWTDTGYCFHSDHALAFFINFYHIPVADGTLALYRKPRDKIRRRNSFVALGGGNGTECLNEKELCSYQHRICHYITPRHMDELYAQQHQAAQIEKL